MTLWHAVPGGRPPLEIKSFKFRDTLAAHLRGRRHVHRIYRLWFIVQQG